MNNIGHRDLAEQLSERAHYFFTELGEDSANIPSIFYDMDQLTAALEAIAPGEQLLAFVGDEFALGFLTNMIATQPLIDSLMEAAEYEAETET